MNNYTCNHPNAPSHSATLINNYWHLSRMSEIGNLDWGQGLMWVVTISVQCCGICQHYISNRNKSGTWRFLVYLVLVNLRRYVPVGIWINNTQILNFYVLVTPRIAVWHFHNVKGIYFQKYMRVVVEYDFFYFTIQVLLCLSKVWKLSWNRVTTVHFNPNTSTKTAREVFDD